VVRESLPGGTRVASIFSQKPGFHSFLAYVSGFVSKQINFPVAAIPIVSRHYDLRCAGGKFTPHIDKLVEGKQKQKSH